MAKHKYPSELRQRALSLHREGQGYLTIAQTLGVPTATVRYWIVVRNEDIVGSPDEPVYEAACREYENSAESLLELSRRLGLKYLSLRNYIIRNSPESELRHTCYKGKQEILTACDEALRRLDKELQDQLARLKQL